MDKLAKHSIHRYILPCLMVASTLLVAASLTSSIAYANHSESTAVTASAVIPSSCTMSGQGASSHSANTPSGTYTPDIGTTTVNVICNDPSGFSIYAAGFTGGEMGQENSNKLVGANTGSTIVTGTATSAGVEDKSNWAMKLATDSGAAFEMTLSDGYDDYHEVPNSYTKVATRTSATDIGPSAVGSTLTTTYATYISKTQPADTYTGQVKYLLMNPHSAAPPAPGTFAAAYANAGKAKYKNYYKMQDINDTICANVDEYQAETLIDARDDNTYTVAKIAGACWMTQNLRITGTVSAEGSNFTGSDINVSAYDFKTDGTTGGACASSNGYNNPCSHIPDERDLSTTGLTAEQLGVWYNYAAASANTIIGSSNTDPATEDICPAGWHLPSKDGATGSFSSLTGNAQIVTAFLPVTSGYYSGSSIGGTTGGCWWSTTAWDYRYRYRLYYNGSNKLDISYYYRRYEGYTVRCVSQAN